MVPGVQKPLPDFKIVLAQTGPQPGLARRRRLRDDPPHE